MTLSAESTPAQSEYAISLRNLTRAINHKTILRDISLDIPTASTLQILGPSGSGKSSLLRLLNRLDEPTSGHIQILNQPLNDWSPSQLRQHVALVFQQPAMMDLTVRQNLQLGWTLHHQTPPDADERETDS